MSTTLRYLIAGSAAILLTLGPLAWSLQFRQNFRAQFVKLIKDQARAKGDMATANAPDADIVLTDFGTELSSGDMNRLLICDLLWRFWWVWMMLSCGIGNGLFIALGRIGAVPKSP